MAGCFKSWTRSIVVGLLLGAVAFTAPGEAKNLRRSGCGGSPPPPLGYRPQNTGEFRYLTKETEKFRVTHLPEVNYDIGEMYSGNIAVGTNESNTLFFVFQPKLGDPVDEITIYLQGGPGCSSLEAFFQENGLFLWQPGTYVPVENPYAWVNETNMLWIDQPIGTGFSQGTPSISSEEELAEQFIDFFLNFEEIFGIRNYNIYLSGESAAGKFCPYIASEMINRNDEELLNISGMFLVDPCIGDCSFVQEEVPCVDWVKENQPNLRLNDSFMALLDEIDAACNLTSYMDEYLVFPPVGYQPTSDLSEDCDVYILAFQAMVQVNPCFSQFETSLQCPVLFDPLGLPTLLAIIPPGFEVYFNRTDVKLAMHAPLDISWTMCTTVDVFVGGDSSPNAALSTLPKVIEHTNRVLVTNGDLDFVSLTKGTLLAIQNMTWNGQLGFQSQPNTSILITTPDLVYDAAWTDAGFSGWSQPGPEGIDMGVQHYERGLMWAQTYMAGHMQPQYQPRSSYSYLQWMLGRKEHL